MNSTERDPGWPPPAQRPTTIGPPSRAMRPSVAGWCAIAAGVAGIIGALLPAFAGQRVGDPDTAVFWIGLALGTTGSAGAIGVGVTALSRPAASTTAKTLSITAVVLGGIALLLTAALFLSG